MKKRIDELTAILAEDSKMTKLDVVLSILVALFSGVLLGILISPRRDKTSYFGCGNGNSYSGISEDECEGCECDNCGECDCEGGLCCQEDCDEERCCGEHEYCGNKELCCKDDPVEEKFKIAEEEEESLEAAEASDKEAEGAKKYVKIR